MTLKLQRELSTNLSTGGSLYVNDVFECYTLEDVVRDGEKIPGQTAIPAGCYQIIITRSERFKRDMPLLVGVKGFEGIRIHSGNTAKDTSGCILVGYYREGADTIRGSVAAFDPLYWKIKDSLFRNESVWIDILKAC